MASSGAALVPCIGGDLVVGNLHLDPSMTKAQTESHVGAVANVVHSFSECPTFIGGDLNFVPLGEGRLDFGSGKNGARG